MNADKLKNIISRKTCGDNTISAQLYQMFFFERMLDRISKSKYKNNIILKGGLLLSSIIGEDMRTTKDMDTTLKSITLKKENIISIMQEIINIDVGDNVNYEIIDIKDIREEDEYGGFKINILGKLEKLKVNMFIEFTTGDKITPKEMEYYYNCIFENKKIPILAYTIETIISEKFETIVSRNITNTRLKDFYDIGILLSGKYRNYNEKILIEAIKNTFKKRNTTFDISEIKRTIELIKNDTYLNKSWQNYQEKFTWAKPLTYESIITELEELIILIEEKQKMKNNFIDDASAKI